MLLGLARRRCTRLCGLVDKALRSNRVVALAALDKLLLHKHRPVLAVQPEVEAACVADGVAVVVTAPQRRHRRAAVLAYVLVRNYLDVLGLGDRLVV